MRISDISVSRKHAILRVVSGKELWILDGGSKFGTLLQITQPLKIERGQRYQVQGGRSLLTFELADPPSCCALMGCCRGGRVTAQGAYFNQNRDYFSEDYEKMLNHEREVQQALLAKKLQEENARLRMISKNNSTQLLEEERSPQNRAPNAT